MSHIDRIGVPKPHHPHATRRHVLPGQGTVEFALVFMVLMMLLYGILEVSRLVFINSEIDNAAREAARYAALVPGVNHDNLVAVVNSKMALGDRSAITVLDPAYPNSIDGSRCIFCTVRVTVMYQWTSWVPILHLGPVTLESSATVLVENAGR